MSKPNDMMRDVLLARGFSFEHPDVRCAWEAFKAFAVTPIPGMPQYCAGYECENFEDRDDVLWLVLARRSELALVPTDIGCVFSCVVPEELRGVRESSWWWPEHETFGAWASHVERMPVFDACMKLKSWRWEGFSA